MPSKVLVFDSGLGGLTVLAEIAKLRPDARLVYAADDADFPYGRWPPSELNRHVVDVVASLIGRTAPDAVVIACNTASTLVLPDLRARFAHLPFIGTVPAIKPAAAQSRSKLVSVLATPGTVARDYTRDLIGRFAADCDVALVGSTRLAALAEAALGNGKVEDADISAEIAPCFVTVDDRRTDTIVLACTHFPLLRDRLGRLAPWPVTWIDPAPAIARRLDAVLTERGMGPADRGAGTVETIFTSGRDGQAAVRRTLDRLLATKVEDSPAF